MKNSLIVKIVLIALQVMPAARSQAGAKARSTGKLNQEIAKSIFDNLTAYKNLKDYILRGPLGLNSDQRLMALRNVAGQTDIESEFPKCSLADNRVNCPTAKLRIEVDYPTVSLNGVAVDLTSMGTGQSSDPGSVPKKPKSVRSLLLGFFHGLLSPAANAQAQCTQESMARNVLQTIGMGATVAQTSMFAYSMIASTTAGAAALAQVSAAAAAAKAAAVAACVAFFYVCVGVLVAGGVAAAGVGAYKAAKYFQDRRTMTARNLETIQCDRKSGRWVLLKDCGKSKLPISAADDELRDLLVSASEDLKMNLNEENCNKRSPRDLASLPGALIGKMKAIAEGQRPESDGQEQASGQQRPAQVAKAEMSSHSSSAK